MYDSGFYNLHLYDGVCDSANKIEKLTGTMPMEDKWIKSSSGRNMFIYHENGRYVIPGNEGFSAKIHYGIEIELKNFFNYIFISRGSSVATVLPTLKTLTLKTLVLQC